MTTSGLRTGRKPLKVLQVLLGGAWGGGSVVVLTIIKALLARGDEVWAVCCDDENARRYSEAGVKVVRAPLWFHAINPCDAVLFAYLWALCLRGRFDLVATHTSKGGLLGRLAARLAGVPNIVHHAHGFSFCRPLGGKAHRFFVALERFAARAGDAIISVNEKQRQMAIDLGVDTPERIRAIHNGIDLRAYEEAMPERENARRELGFSESDLLVGVVGRLTEQKGLPYIIRAMPEVIAAIPSARLVFVGEGPLESELRQEVERARIKDRVHFLGFCRNVPRMLAAFDVYALPSLWEGHSISLLEAVAAGKAVVATDIEGNRETIEHGISGLLVPPADPAALAEGVRTLLADRALAKQMGESALRTARDRFTQERMVEQNVQVYDSVVSGKLHRSVQGRQQALSGAARGG